MAHAAETALSALFSTDAKAGYRSRVVAPITGGLFCSER